MAEPATLGLSVARDWIARWERQQEVYLADREDRFTALIDAVEVAAGRPDPLVIDLGCGPGSLAVRLLRRLPSATVIAVDADRSRCRSAWQATATCRACGSSTWTCGCPAGRQD